MKILWYTMTPCGAGEKLMPNLFIAGWLAALEQQVKQDQSIDLSVCFYHNEPMDPFIYKSVTYYPVYKETGKSKLTKFKTRIKSFGTNSDAPFIAQLVSVAETVKPDIIHVHGCEENFGLIQEHIKTPLVISIQSLLNPYCEKFFSGIPLQFASKNETLTAKLLFDSAKHQFFLLSKWAKREARILQNAEFIIGRTSWDKRITRILAPKSTYFTGNEIMRQPFYNSKWDKKSFGSTIRIVTTMSGGLYKGLESVLKTAAILTSHNLDFEWTVIGQAETDKYPKMVSRWLNKSYLQNKVMLVGRKNERDVVSILCNADIYCQVSHIENSPNSLCEAMLLGMPIAATFAGGTDSMLKNGHDGLLVQDGDSLSLAGTIIELATDFEKSKQYGSNARQTALVKHNPQKVAKEVIDAYKKIYSVTNEQ
ncbi:MAG: glycosyltransferase family 4 protein [Chitinophagaceae bacterium]